MTKDKVLTGAAGAYYVGFQLSELGYAVGLTTHGTKAIDMFVANRDTGKSITVQTKTMRDASYRSGTESWWHWRVSKSLPTAHESFFYAFVDLRNGPPQTPDVFIVPSPRLPSLIYDYPDWCDIEEEDAQKYRNRWDIIDNVLAQNMDCHF